MSVVSKQDRTRKGFMDFFNEQGGELSEMFLSHYAKTYEDGIFSAKVKRLMAMVGALAAGCEGCIVGQCRRAIDLGATRAEIIEACGVVVSLGGTMAGSRVSLIMQVMEELEVK
jgi:alkylhydroperoxidase/carboxymuconolactone decarboxylase family protein YurZ